MAARNETPAHTSLKTKSDFGSSSTLVSMDDATMLHGHAIPDLEPTVATPAATSNTPSSDRDLEKKGKGSARGSQAAKKTSSAMASSLSNRIKVCNSTDRKTAVFVVSHGGGIVARMDLPAGGEGFAKVPKQTLHVLISALHQDDDASAWKRFFTNRRIPTTVAQEEVGKTWPGYIVLQEKLDPGHAGVPFKEFALEHHFTASDFTSDLL